jgi:RNA polymerase sigma-70 factor (ECF subfamily)
MDAASFEKALPAVLPRLRALAARLVGHPDETEDVLQDALVRATRAIGGFRGESSLETWLYSITARVALDHLGARRRFRAQVMVDACNDAGREQLLGIFEDPSVAFDVHEHISFCFGCVGRTLDPEENAAIVLREVLGLGNQECAQVLGVTESVFRHRLSAARERMEREYEGLCALVNKAGPCHQCRTLREVAPEGRQGPALPVFPLPFAERLRLTLAAHTEGTPYALLRDHFSRASTAMNDAGP